MSLSLCNTHYQKLYGILNKPVACVSCAEKPRVGQCFIRNCPDAPFITQYLKEHKGFEGTITKDSKVWKDGVLEPKWDSDHNIAKVQTKVTYLTKGCKCKKSCKGIDVVVTR